jgi:AraC family transcriptional regulator of adaptative response/methylated-DNA-[protein]-cysteine methyltransferase
MIAHDLSQAATDYRRVEQAIGFLEANFREQPSLDEIAASVNLSKFHFQRLFKRWAGISPTQFLRFLTVEYAKDRLRESQTVLDATFDAGLSSPSRLHDLFVTFEAMTPGEYKQQGAGLEIVYGLHDTPFGQALLATTERGICALYFVPNGDRSAVVDALRERWPRARMIEDAAQTQPLIERMFSRAGNGGEQPFHLLLQGTNFQVKVWQALLAIPPGSVASYGDLAAYIGQPRAARAVGAAVGRNPIAYLIPCHRVITQSGEAHRYRWGTARKKAMLVWEAVSVTARREAQATYHREDR